MNLIQSRAYERSSSFVQDCKRGALIARERIEELRQTIEMETEIERFAIRERVDAEQFQRELINSIPDNKKTEQFFAELKTEPKQEKPSLPVGLALPPDELENPEFVAELLGVSVNEVNKI